MLGLSITNRKRQQDLFPHGTTVRRIATWGAGALALALCLISASVRTRVVHAQSGCTVASMQGGYGYTVTGYYFDNMGNYNFYSAAGNFVADGAGNLKGKETDAFNGGVVRGDPYTGTYSVNSDCSAALTTNSAALGPANYDIVLSNGGTTMQMVESDTGTNVSGVGARQ